MKAILRLHLTVSLTLALATIASTQAPEPGPTARGGQGPLPGGRGGRFGGIPPRDNAQAQTGTAKITGHVVSAESGLPIRRAQISVNSRDTGFARTVATDSEGRYELSAVPAGRYRLFVNKAGYVPLEYGQSRPFEAGKPIDMTAGEVLEKVDFSLPRGSAITGRITDEFGIRSPMCKSRR
jgi:5-hydroxyisourate hydrolase-like protein (transthyretin family)